MFSFFKKFRPKAPENTVLALDIGTEFVKALIYRIEEGHGFVTGYAKIRQSSGAMMSGAVSDIAAVTQACESAIATAAKQAGYRPEQAVLGIAGELVRGSATTIEYTRENQQTRIDMPELRSIVQTVQRRAFDQVRAELARDTGYSDLDIKLVHAAVLQARIDGMEATNPIGFQGSSVQISVFNAFAPLTHFGALQTIAAELELDLLTIVTEPFAVARAFVDRDQPGIFIDVGGGTTDVALVRGDELLMKIFALGGRTFTKRLSQDFQVGHGEAERIKLDYAGNRLPEKQTRLVRKSLLPDAEVWLAGVELALSDLAGDLQLPPRILLCGGGTRLPEIREFLTSSDFAAGLPFPKQPTVAHLTPEDIEGLTDETGLLRSAQDVTPLSLAKLGLQLSGEEKLLSGMLRKAIKLIQT